MAIEFVNYILISVDIITNEVYQDAFTGDLKTSLKASYNFYR